MNGAELVDRFLRNPRDYSDVFFRVFRRRMAERREHLTPEERERFRRGMKPCRQRPTQRMKRQSLIARVRRSHHIDT